MSPAPIQRVLAPTLLPLAAGLRTRRWGGRNGRILIQLVLLQTAGNSWRRFSALPLAGHITTAAAALGFEQGVAVAAARGLRYPVTAFQHGGTGLACSF
jgi:hypothetical protein